MPKQPLPGEGLEALRREEPLLERDERHSHLFMRFAIDVAFVSRDGRVLEVRAAVKPWRLAWRAFAVIELPAGALARSDTRPGDLLQVTAT